MKPKGKADWAKASADHVLKASGFQISFYKGSRFLIFPVLQFTLSLCSQPHVFPPVLLLYLPSYFIENHPNLSQTVSVYKFFNIGFN